MKRIACIRWKMGGRDSRADDRAGQVIERCRRFSPMVGREPTDHGNVLLDITGLAGLFGGERAMTEQMVHDLDRLGLQACVAIADTIGAAWAASAPKEASHAGSTFVLVSHDETAAFLAPLPVERLRLPSETIRWLHELGLVRIGQLGAMPREGFLARFGPILLRRLDQAFGRLDETMPVVPPPPEFAARWSPEYPTVRRETIEAAVRRLLGRVAALLAGADRGALRIECRFAFQRPASDVADEARSTSWPNRPELTGATGGLSTRVLCTAGQASSGTRYYHRALAVSLFRPSANAKHLFELAAIPLERLPVASPVTEIRVAATLTGPLAPPRQASLFAMDDDRQPRGPAALIERLSSRLGRDGVLGVRLRPEAQPELAWHYDPLTGVGRRCSRGRRPPAELPPRPLRLLPRPILLNAASVAPDGPPLAFSHAGQRHTIAHAWGPERIETGWWRGRPVGRDYFRVETVAGGRYWLFRRLRDGKWFLHGLFE